MTSPAATALPPPYFKGLVLGIETSCDETSASVVSDGIDVRSNVVASQVEEHTRFGGIVPEIASRAHLERLQGVTWQALDGAQVDLRDIDAIAVTNGPGLAGALLVGLAGAKALALARGLPLITVNHLEGHLFASMVERHSPELPAVALLVSGGHTMLIEIREWGDYVIVGSTLDDAAGEAFDKVGRYLGLGFPGGPAIDKAAREGDPAAFALPRAMLRDGYDFSFSGLKTAVVKAVDSELRAGRSVDVPDMAASFQEAAVDVLAEKAVRATLDLDSGCLLVGGGVAANERLRSKLGELCGAKGIECVISTPSLCTDNAAMIAAAGAFRLEVEGPTSLGAGAHPSLTAPFRFDPASRAAVGAVE